jgi:zinc transport system substrate-binding protein
MKKLLFLLLFNSLSFAKTDIVVSILPQKIFVDKIGGDKVETSIMVKAGASPHNYSPKPSQMRKISKADIYFTIGVEFEEIWLTKFTNQNRELVVVDSTKGIKKNKTIDHHKEHHPSKLDPHIWVNPINVKIIAQNITNALISEDSNNSNYYKNNLKTFLIELDALDLEIKNILEKTAKNSAFMVFHPSWGYFAKQYSLRQIAVEAEGKEPKMRALVKLMKKAKEEKIKAIFTQPEFSDKSAQILAKNLNIRVIKASPLAENWSETLTNLAKAIAGKE